MNKIRDATQQEIIDSLPIPAHGLANIAPRVGKTKIGIKILKKEKVKKALWVTPSTKLRDIDIPNEFIKWNAKVLLRNTDIVCYASLANVTGEYDKVILDEYQEVTEANTEPLFNGKIKYKSILGLSGSHPKHWEKQFILDELGLKILVKIGIEEAIDKGIIADYNINIVECKMNYNDKNIEAGNKEKKWMQTEAEAYNYLSRNIFKPFFAIKRLRMIYDSPSKENTAIALLDKLKGRRKLVFCSSIEQAKRLGKDATYHSKTNDKMLNKFLNQEINELYCVNSGGIGFTYENVDDFIIIQANSDKKGQTTQKLARSLLDQGKKYKGNIWFICLVDTKDADWLNSALTEFDTEKIKRLQIKDIENGIE